MGQKILAYLFYGFLILMVIAALILLKYQLDHKDIKQQQIDSRANVLTHVDKDQTTQAKSNTGTDNNKQKKPAKTKIQSKTKQAQDAEPLSFLDIYHQLQDAKACQSYFFFWQRDGTQADITHLVSRPFSYYGEPAYARNEKPPLTAGQHEQLIQWRDKCQDLWQTYGDFEQDDDSKQVMLNAIQEQIERRLNKTAAKTPHEIKLKEVLKITAQWQQKRQALDEALVGEDSLSEPELAQINDQIEQLNKQRKQFWQEANANPNNDIPDEAIQAEIVRINQESNRLHTLISEQKVKNPDKIQQLTAELDALDQRLFQYFYTSYGDVFYEALRTQVGHTQMRALGHGYSMGRSVQKITPIEMVLEDNNLIKNRFYMPSLGAATILYLCDLGMDCSQDSPLMYEFCLSGYPTYPDSCGLNAYDFYRQFLISPNHWPDVTNFMHSYEDIFNG